MHHVVFIDPRFLQSIDRIIKELRTCCIDIDPNSCRSSWMYVCMLVLIFDSEFSFTKPHCAALIQSRYPEKE